MVLHSPDPSSRVEKWLFHKKHEVMWLGGWKVISTYFIQATRNENSESKGKKQGQGKQAGKRAAQPHAKSNLCVTPRRQSLRTNICIVANCFNARSFLQHALGMRFGWWGRFGEFGSACKKRAKWKVGVITFTWQPVEGFTWVNGFLIDSLRPWQRQ